jgi:hypothetical protein
MKHSGNKSPENPTQETDMGALPWDAEQLKSGSTKEHWVTERKGDRDIYYIGDSHLRVILRMNWNNRNRHGEGFPGASLRHLCPHPRKDIKHELFRLQCPPQDSPDYRVYILQLGGNDVHNKRFHQTNDNNETEDLAKQKQIPVKRQTAGEFELITTETIIQKMKRAMIKLRRKFPNSHIVQLSIQPRQEADGKTTISTVRCITEEIKKERIITKSLFDQGDPKVHYLEITGVWESGGQLRRELYNDKGYLAHMSTQGNNTLDSLYSQIEAFLTEENFNRQDNPSKRLTGTCNNGKITLHNSPPKTEEE